MTVPELKSDRLIYKPLTSKFLSQEYVNWLNDPEVTKYMVSGGGERLETLSVFLKQAEQKQILFWAIIIADTGKHIGNIKIDPIVEKNGLGEYGIMMGDKSEWGKGYAKEASLTIIDYCFDVLNLRKITLGVVSDNTTAIKLYERLNFVVEGIFIKHEIYDNKFCDILRMALFNKNYRTS